MIGSYFIGAHTNPHSERGENQEISMSIEDCAPCEDLVGHVDEISYDRLLIFTDDVRIRSEQSFLKRPTNPFHKPGRTVLHSDPVRISHLCGGSFPRKQS